MPDRILIARIEGLEDRMKVVDKFLADFDQTLEKHFRKQAEMLDERFTDIDRRFEDVDRRIATMGSDITGLQRDMTIVRDGISVLLKRR